MRRLLAVPLALLLGLVPVAHAADLQPGGAADLQPGYAADLEPMVTKAPVYKAAPEPVYEAPPWILLVPLGVLIAACVTDFCKEGPKTP